MMSNTPPTIDDFLGSETPTTSSHLNDEENSPNSKDAVIPHSTVELSNMAHPRLDAAASSLPHPAEITPETSTRKLPSRRAWLLIAGGISVLLLVLILGVSIGVSAKKSNGSSQSSAPGKELSLSEVADWVVRSGISSRNMVLTEGTPQNRAAQYLATTDAFLGDTDSSTEAYLDAFKYVMAVVYYSTNGDRWFSPLNFMLEDSICNWKSINIAFSETGEREIELKGVLCDSQGIPNGLDLELNNIDGSIPTELGFLTTLELLDFEFNLITGAIPTEFCQLSDLKLLLARTNQMSGKLPQCEWPEMLSLRLRQNEFTGEIPDEFCSMQKLTTIEIDKNELKGQMPSCGAKDWPNLQLLSLSDNLLTGTLARQVASLPKLTHIFVDGNALNGNPISTINAMTSLKMLYIEENFFTGTIDGNFAQDFNDLLVMDISENNFTSTDGLPVHLFNLPKLIVLDLSMNLLKGTIPEAIPTQNNLEFFSLFQNQMTGSIPSSLANLGKLLHIDVASNALTGPMPAEIFNMTSLGYIFLSENNFTEGPIPEMVGMEQLRELSIKNTNRIGPLPTFDGFDDLFLLVLDNNQITGTVPANYGKLTNLRHLLLGRNQGLSGDLPEFTEPSNIGTVLVDKTGISGDFTSLCDLPTISGAVEIGSDVIVLADCDDPDSGITCECCRCCSRDQEVCSEPIVTSLDWTWEYGLRRTARNFAVNYTLFEDSPDDASAK